jgi:DNA-binding transcriptional MerR regulator
MNKPAPGKLTLGQLGKRVGLARTSVLHYESLGLLTPCARSAAGYRLYGEAELERLRTIRRFRDAGLSLADIRDLFAPPSPPGRHEATGPAELLEKRLLDLSRAVERVREQQRSLARLLAVPEFRDGTRRWDKAAWVMLLRRAGFDDAAMAQWHAEFEQQSPQDHAAFLESLGLAPAEVAEIRNWSRNGKPPRRGKTRPKS